MLVEGDAQGVTVLLAGDGVQDTSTLAGLLLSLGFVQPSVDAATTSTGESGTALSGDGALSLSWRTGPERVEVEIRTTNA